MDRLVGSGAFEGACLLQLPLGQLPAGVRAQLPDPAAPARLAEALQMLEAMGLVTADGCEPGARAGGPPTAVPMYAASALVQLEEPEDLAHPHFTASSWTCSCPPPIAPGARHQRCSCRPRTSPAAASGGRSGACDLRLYWARLEFLCTLWRAKMAFCFPANWEPGAVSLVGWSSALPLGREEALDLEAFLQERLETLDVMSCHGIARDYALLYPTARRPARFASASADSPFCFLHLFEHAMKQQQLQAGELRAFSCCLPHHLDIIPLSG